MEIVVTPKDGKYPSYNIGIASKPGGKPFLEIKGCRLMNGSKGQFISYPSRKQDDGKYWNHVWASDQFNEAVIKKINELQPAKKPGGSGFDDMADDVPF